MLACGCGSGAQKLPFPGTRSLWLHLLQFSPMTEAEGPWGTQEARLEGGGICLSVF